jgi:thiosulfate/3-mercaptopyruvate sulfurtransferase
MVAAALPLLVETSWLQEHLGDPDLRIFDCSVALTLVDGAMRAESGRAAWAEGHIPGSGFADLIEDLSDSTSPLPFMLPSDRQFAEAMSRYGVGNQHRVVLYDTGTHSWATRLWWMLRVFGFDNASVLNGGWRKWSAEKRPAATDVPAYPATSFVARRRPELVADKSGVRELLGAPDACLINALSAEAHSGKVQLTTRAGRIPGSTNVPAASLVDPTTGAYLPLDELRKRFEASGALDARRVVAYCGGGIAATSAAFILHLLGASDVAVYDGSLTEWSRDPTLPMETDASVASLAEQA